MTVPHQGKGICVVVFGITAAVLMNGLSNKLFDGRYYQNHTWPKLATLWIAGLGCYLLGWYLKKRAPTRESGIQVDQSMSFDPKLDLIRRAEGVGAKHHLLYIPLQYRGDIYFVVGIFVAVRSVW